MVFLRNLTKMFLDYLFNKVPEAFYDISEGSSLKPSETTRISTWNLYSSYNINLLDNNIYHYVKSLIYVCSPSFGDRHDGCCCNWLQETLSVFPFKTYIR